MSAIFGFFFFIIIIVLVFGLSIISAILRLLFGFGRKANTRTYHKGTDERTSDNSSSNVASDSKSKHKKIFDKEDGEYVEFEEIKEDK